MSQYKTVARAAFENYSASTPWPKNDPWHMYTLLAEKNVVEDWLVSYANTGMRILNAGSGGTEYQTKGTLIHLDIVEKYIEKFEEHIVGSTEKIELPDASMDGVICVGSVLNYTDAQRSISEFSRILRPGGFLILEFERSNSAEFLWTGHHGKYIFSKEYHYNGQNHLLWMYSENHIRQLLQLYQFSIKRCRRIHCLSSLLNRLGVSEPSAAPYSRFDPAVQVISYPLAHNVMLLGTK